MINTVRPIFLVQLPNATPKETISEVSTLLTAKLCDWHVLVVATTGSDSPQFNAYTVNNAQEIDLQELKQLVHQKMRQNATNN